MPIYVVILLNCLVCGFVGLFVANKRGMDHGFLWGFFLAEIGIVIVALRPDESRAAQGASPQKVSEEMERLKDLYSRGVLTEEEYQRMRKNFLEQL